MVILGRVITGDIAVTVVDLAIRNFIRAEEAASTQRTGSPNQDW